MLQARTVSIFRPREERDPQRALEALASEWRVWGFRLAIKITGDPDLAEDALQDALLRALRHHRGLRDLHAAKGWFRRILVRCALDQCPAAMSGEMPVCAVQADLEEGLAVKSVLSAMKPEQRALLALAIGEGLSYEEIASSLAIPVGTVASRLHTAKQAFRAKWEDPR
ncbi:MAG: RNA polymerase sigma factor [Armatimonadetes bacterium]|nr:RNA polymerase sigma factor [Armatimonadota bacterium]